MRLQKSKMDSWGFPIETKSSGVRQSKTLSMSQWFGVKGFMY